MSEEIRRINGVEICTESFGLPDSPCILLIMGAMASMVWWDKEFCQQLAKQGRFVIRYDNRDVGRSICYPPGEIHYSIHDLVDDSVAVLDSYHIEKAHFVGMSFGGRISQMAALKYPNRVRSITAIASAILTYRPDLASLDDRRILAHHNKSKEVDWENVESVKEYLVDFLKLFNGTRHPFDREQALTLAEEEIRRAKSLMSMFNHDLIRGGEELYGDLSKLCIPVLAIHGTEDTVVPYSHAQALTEAIPGTRLVTLEGAGHEIHKKDWDLVISEISVHTEENLK